MPHSYGVRARTRSMFSRDFKKKGVIPLSTYLKTYKIGDIVDVIANPAIHKGMPFKAYHGRTGVVFNVSKRAVGVKVKKNVNGRIIEKRINVRIEHVRHSTSRLGWIQRVKDNEAAKKAARERGEVHPREAGLNNVKRIPKQPREAYTLPMYGDINVVQPAQFVDLV